jgi:O-antigen/teichoic acid export membrane protein
MFGGVQVIQIIATMVKAKFSALFLGASGMGISGLLVSSVAFIQTISSFGLNTSAVREISLANEKEDRLKLSYAIIVFRRWLLSSTILGLILVLVFSPWLSKFVFGNSDYTLKYAFLSLLVALNILGNGYVTILQGTRRLRDLAKSSIIGAILSASIVIPIYYFFRINGIVLALICSSAVSFLISLIFAKKIKLEKIPIGIRKTISEGSDMSKLGLIMMITSLMGTLTILLINTFITRKGSLTDVGLYQAGMNITNQSIGLVFTAMSVDYFPRLSAVCKDNQKVGNLANQQAEIMLLIVTPILLLLIISAPLLIRILLSPEFKSISNFIRFISLGMFFQAANYAMGLISFAKGDKKTFLFLGAIGNSLWLFFSVIGYLLWGLLGVSMCFVVHSAICFFIVYLTANRKYNYLMSKSFTKLLILCLLPIAGTCALVILIPNLFGYLISCLIFCCLIVYCIYKLNEFIGLKEIFISTQSRFK